MRFKTLTIAIVTMFAPFALAEPDLAQIHSDAPGIAWFNGENLYQSTGHGFLYLPHAAIL